MGKMLLHDFSQLPVLQGERNLKGVISWKSIGQAFALKKSLRFVRDCMEPRTPIALSTPIREAIRAVSDHDAVFTQDEERRICGVVSSHDLSVCLEGLATPFLILQQIEVQVRQLLDAAFCPHDLDLMLVSSQRSRTINSAADLTFGDYVRILENPDNWTRFNVAVSRDVFVSALEEVRCVRNDVMHFRPSGISPEQLAHLARFTQLLQKIIAVKKSSPRIDL